jgi:hypothetical protein
MDDLDLTKPDPKRSGLEDDRIIIETMKNALKSLLDLYPSSLDQDKFKLKQEQEGSKKMIFKYIIEQKNILIKLIDLYDEQINKLTKDDSL